MFTGLIEDCGHVRAIRRSGEAAVLSIVTALPVRELVLGESIAVNGACLTVTTIGSEGFDADVSPETFSRTTLGRLRPGQPVNLERALRLGDRLGGHLMTGHIDEVGRIVSRHSELNAVILEIEAPPSCSRYLVEKGSVALDGISLTVNAIDGSRFRLSVIPHTIAMTTLKNCTAGSEVNIETDLLGKYVERLLTPAAEGVTKPSLSRELLAKHGFL
jgi:riboflavin synthase